VNTVIILANSFTVNVDHIAVTVQNWTVVCISGDYSITIIAVSVGAPCIITLIIAITVLMCCKKKNMKNRCISSYDFSNLNHRIYVFFVSPTVLSFQQYIELSSKISHKIIDIGVLSSNKVTLNKTVGTLFMNKPNYLTGWQWIEESICNTETKRCLVQSMSLNMKIKLRDDV